jgi:hypothetical protein
MMTEWSNAMRVHVKLAALVAVPALGLAGCATQAPDTAPAPTVPAPLPPGTGVDGAPALAVPSIAATDPAVVQPQAGDGATATVQPAPDNGVGGEVYVATGGILGPHPVRLNAGYWYPSGSFHGGWDLAASIGTPIYAPRDAVVIGMRDGVPNLPLGCGSACAVPGSASNWIMLCAAVNGHPASLYFQHQSPGIRRFVRVGQHVRAGQRIGTTGLTGNTTGPHLHLSAQFLRPGQNCSISNSQADGERYDYLRFDSLRLFAPALFWAVPQPAPKTIRLGKSRKIAWIAGRYGVKPYLICRFNPTITRCGPQRRLRAGFVVRLGR